MKSDKVEEILRIFVSLTVLKKGFEQPIVSTDWNISPYNNTLSIITSLTLSLAQRAWQKRLYDSLQS